MGGGRRSRRRSAAGPGGGGGVKYALGGVSKGPSREDVVVPHEGGDGCCPGADPDGISPCPAGPGHGSLKAALGQRQEEAWTAAQERAPEASPQAGAAHMD